MINTIATSVNNNKFWKKEINDSILNNSKPFRIEKKKFETPILPTLALIISRSILVVESKFEKKSQRTHCHHSNET